MKHVVIPDTQVRPGVPLEHLTSAGNYIAHQKPDVIIHLGDHWDMASLNSHERPGSKFFEEKSYGADVESGHKGFMLLNEPIEREIRNSKRRKKAWRPRRVYLRGNHEYRVTRTLNNLPILEGAISYDDLMPPKGWECHDFLDIVEIDGIAYSHYFVNQQSLKKGILGGTIDNRLNKIKQSFTMGHQQTRMHGTQYTSTGKELNGLVVGAFYQHDEDYMGPQGNHYWRGLVVKNEVKDGSYDPMFVSIKYLMDNWV